MVAQNLSYCALTIIKIYSATQDRLYIKAHLAIQSTSMSTRLVLEGLERSKGQKHGVHVECLGIIAAIGIERFMKL